MMNEQKIAIQNFQMNSHPDVGNHWILLLAWANTSTLFP